MHTAVATAEPLRHTAHPLPRCAVAEVALAHRCGCAGEPERVGVIHNRPIPAKLGEEHVLEQARLEDHGDGHRVVGLGGAVHRLLVCVVSVQHRTQQRGVVQGGVEADVGVHPLLLEQIDVLEQPVDGHAAPHTAEE